MAYDKDNVFFTTQNNGEVETEVLFESSDNDSQSNYGVFEEPLNLSSQAGVFEEELNDGYYIQEENISFKEPVRPESIAEEVLFKPQDEEVTLTADVEDNPTLISDELSSLSDMQDLSLEGATYDKPAYVEKNFAQKILEADEEILQRYDELKNFILLYKGVKSRVSNDFDSFNMGRTQLFKLGFSTKSLKLYLNLEYDKVETRLKCKDVSSKKAYKEVPVFLRIKSPRAMRNAKYLIEQVAKRFELKENPRAVYVDSIKILKEKAKTYN